jgi:hypothetical protein
MIAAIIAIGAVFIGAVGVLSWRWMEIQEAVKVERERVGGSKLVNDVDELNDRVTRIEKYMKGEN